VRLERRSAEPAAAQVLRVETVCFWRLSPTPTPARTWWPGTPSSPAWAGRPRAVGRRLPTSGSGSAAERSTCCRWATRCDHTPALQHPFVQAPACAPAAARTALACVPAPACDSLHAVTEGMRPGTDAPPRRARQLYRPARAAALPGARGVQATLTGFQGAQRQHVLELLRMMGVHVQKSMQLSTITHVDTRSTASAKLCFARTCARRGTLSSPHVRSPCEG